MNSKLKTAIVFISGSAGELDWILPILDYLMKDKFRLKIIFLSRHALKSVEKNSMCNDFIERKDPNLEVIHFGSYFFEKLEHTGYLVYRVFIKFKLNKIPLIRGIYNLYDSIQKAIFLKCIPQEVLNSKESKYIFFSEFPSLRRPRNNWIKKVFKNSIFFYFPHSPHINTENLNQEFEENNEIDLKKRSFLLLGHPSDYHIINDGKELAAEDLEKLYIGHPKYSQNWLKKLKDEASIFRNKLNERKKINILVLSRGYGSYINEVSQKHLVDSTIRTIESTISNYRLLVKKHPREIISHWDKVQEKYSNIEIVNNHILQIATKADFVISFWGSGSMDCFILGVPIIEYWDPVQNNKQQIPDNNSYTTIYRKLGIVFAANNEEELKNAIHTLLKNKFDTQSIKPHFFYTNLIKRSDNWTDILKKIMSANGF